MEGIGLGNSYKIIFYSQVLIATILFCQLLSWRETNKFVNLSTYFLLVLLGLAWVAFFYRFLGGEAILSIKIAHGTKLYLYLTSFTKYPADSTLRAAGIFDEPGAFSFVICFIALLRHQLDKNKKITWLLIGLGFVTFSLAHIVYTFSIFYLK